MAQADFLKQTIRGTHDGNCRRTCQHRMKLRSYETRWYVHKPSELFETCLASDANSRVFTCSMSDTKFIYSRESSSWLVGWLGKTCSGGGEKAQCYTVTARMILRERWAAVKANVMFH